MEAPGKLDPLRSWGAGELNGNFLWWAVQSRGKPARSFNQDACEAEMSDLAVRLSAEESL